MKDFESWEEPKKEPDADLSAHVAAMNGKDLPHLAWSDAPKDLLAAAWHEIHLRAEIFDEAPTMAEFVANRERAKRKAVDS